MSNNSKDQERLKPKHDLHTREAIAAEITNVPVKAGWLISVVSAIDPSLVQETVPAAPVYELPPQSEPAPAANIEAVASASTAPAGNENIIPLKAESDFDETAQLNYLTALQRVNEAYDDELGKAA